VLLTGVLVVVGHEIWASLLWAARLQTSWTDPWLWDFSGFDLILMGWQLLPFGLLAALWHAFTRPGRSVMLVLIIVLTVLGQLAVETDESSTAVLGFIFFPIYLAVGVLAGFVVDKAAHAVGLYVRHFRRPT
jgi:hypothetical protein